MLPVLLKAGTSFILALLVASTIMVLAYRLYTLRLAQWGVSL